MDVDLTYHLGTCSVAVGATVVVGGGGVIWSQSANVRQWDVISIDGGPLVPIVASAIDDNHISIPAWAGAAKVNVNYVIYQVSPLRFVGGQAMADVDNMLSLLNTDGWYRYVNPAFVGPTEQGITANEGQFALKYTTGQLWIMTSGVWVLVGIFKGFGVAAPYDGAHTYGINDVATLAGSSYVWINATPGSGHSPPNATFWAILAAKGDTGAAGTNGATGPAAWLPPVAWVTGVAMVAGPPATVVVQAGETYVCLVPHTSGTFATDLAAGKWIKVAQQGGAMGSYSRFVYTATAGQTVFTGNDDNSNPLNNNGAAFTEVDIDGLRLIPSDYSVDSSSQITVLNGCDVGQKVYITCFSPFNVSDTLAKSANGGDITDKVAFRSLLPNPGALFGLILSTAGASATFGISAGLGADSTNTRLMRLASAFTKTTSAWAVGTAAGALDTGTIANNTWYHVYEIMRVDTGIVDILVSLSATAPTLPTSYTLFRRIGSMLTNGSAQWVKFSQLGDEFLWDTPFLDGNNITLTTAAVLATLSVPLNIQVLAYFAFAQNPAATAFYLFSSTDTVDILPSISQFNTFATVNGQAQYSTILRTNALQQIRLRASVGAAAAFWQTRGWIDTRGKNG